LAAHGIHSAATFGGACGAQRDEVMISVRPMIGMIAATAAAWLSAVTPAAALAVQVTHPTLGFSLTIPEGFEPSPEVAASNPDFVYAFRKEGDAEGDDPVGTVIIVERMRGTIGRERLDPARVKGRRVLAFKWKGFEIDGVEVPESADGIDFVNYNVQVPLKPEAIQLRVAGQRGRARELRALADGLLVSLDGQTNWLRSSAPPSLATSPQYGTLILGVTLLGVIAGFVVLWLLRRRTRRGTVLALAVLIYGASWAMPRGDTREMRAARGGVRLLGFAGLLLGLYDLRRRPAATPPPVPTSHGRGPYGQTP
jgi:hypothetical protein